MKSNQFLIAAALLFSLTTFTACYQRNDYNTNPYNNNPNYNGNNNYTVAFDEEFNGTDNYGWTFTYATDSAYASIASGSYQYVDYSTSFFSTSAVPTGINISNNFKVQTSVKSNNKIALIFGASSTDNGYAFYIDTAGYYSLYKEGIGAVASTIIIPSTVDTPYAIKNGWNALEVDQTNGTWTGYINGTQVFSMAARSLSGNNCGFKIVPATVAYADYLRVSND